MLEVDNIQKKFFQTLRRQLPEDVLPANEIASLLNISKSEAYNKINGKSHLTVGQIYIICKTFNIRFQIGADSDSDSSLVRFTPFHSGKYLVSDYLQTLNRLLDNLLLQKITKLFCSSDDIPFFHLFKYPELAAFKLHFWESRICKYGEAKAEKTFDAKNLNAIDIEVAKKLHKTYLSIPSLEIWTSSYLLMTPAQIKYAFESQLIKDAVLGKLLCDQLLHVLDDIENYAIQNNKGSNVPFEWYQCEVVGSVTYLTNLPEKQECFVRFNTFNHFHSSDEELCKEVEMWLGALKGNSVGFSGQGSRQRTMYLQDVRKLIETLKDDF